MIEPKIYVDDKYTAESDDYVCEYCSMCENEIELQWSTKRWGYKAFCPHCGTRLMLCDECQHRTDGSFLDDCDYDFETDSCRYNPDDEVCE